MKRPITLKMWCGILALPAVLVASCAGKMYYDDTMYELPGEVLKSSAKPGRSLDTAMNVAEALDSYVQPRFTILRDNEFGAIRFTFRKHAGVVQLKVDSAKEKQIIANVNAANREYAICLLHCAPKPLAKFAPESPRLEILYLNQNWGGENLDLPLPDVHDGDDKALSQLHFEALQRKAIAALPALMAGHEYRASNTGWDVLMRPVPARQTCLSCHSESKLGDTLGVMVYAVREKQREPARTIRAR
ncbi:MAG TPA: hypothetical protein VKT77_00075 [Chthonomonadaceae bacterium]|nr:hypothetical protein [Chthonomonadaceae bacterium]